MISRFDCFPSLTPHKAARRCIDSSAYTFVLLLSLAACRSSPAQDPTTQSSDSDTNSSGSHSLASGDASTSEGSQHSDASTAHSSSQDASTSLQESSTAQDSTDATTSTDASTTENTDTSSETTSTTTQDTGGEPCGYKNQGTTLKVSPTVTMCVPPLVCNTHETCPPDLGDCVDGVCVFKGDYKGLRTLPQAWATWYCDLSTGCNGVTQFEPAKTTATKVAQQLALPLCFEDDSSACVGIVASSPWVMGNSLLAKDPATGTYIKNWGLGMTEANGLCYEVQGPGGKAVVALTDRCAGYCDCETGDYRECGECLVLGAEKVTPNCACVGAVPGLFTDCCGPDCAQPAEQKCDWCASNNHPHFDLDQATFNHVCGDKAIRGSCELQSVNFVPCMDPNPNWPPKP